ncbi:mercuric transporter MerT family protein [Sphingobium scionense]
MPSAVFLGAVATSSCGIGPQIIFSLGIGAGPWIANLTALAPYTPLSVAGTAGSSTTTSSLVCWKLSGLESKKLARGLPDGVVKF